MAQEGHEETLLEMLPPGFMWHQLQLQAGAVEQLHLHKQQAQMAVGQWQSSPS